MTAPIRCAIYTRKSSDDGLEQEFNSLHAQREACEAYIKSQRSSGWTALSTNYDDGGLSGGTLNRPALQALMTDIKGRKVDLVVVYKVDRLTRSLNDFAKIVEVFDAHDVSFVSVTQQFNTTTSMGRLTLNMLLSFAQFEREVTGERIRDKIAASKQKGMWMGGAPPLGYDVADRKLVVNETEAETVRQLYELYLKLGSVRALRDEANRLGIVTKHRMLDGRTAGGKPYSRGNLYRLLANPLYIGEMPHKGKRYPGQHQAIVDHALWDLVQSRLSEGAPARRTNKNGNDSHLLTGLAFDETGDVLSPTHTNKRGRRYRYYVSRRLLDAPDRHGDGWRVRARELEEAVRQSICTFLKNERRLIEALPLVASALGQIRRLIRGGSELANELTAGAPSDQRDKLRYLIHRATLSRTVIRIEISERKLLELTLEQPQDKTDGSNRLITIEAPMTMRRRGVETKLVLAFAHHRSPDDKLIALVARSHRWIEELSNGAVGSVREIARRGNLDESDVTRFLPLAFLAPDFVQALLEGRQPPELTAVALRQVCPVPPSWERQHEVLEPIARRKISYLSIDEVNQLSCVLSDLR